MDEDAQFTATKLQRRADHFLPFNDKSVPKRLKEVWFSKSQFKRALRSFIKHV